MSFSLSVFLYIPLYASLSICLSVWCLCLSISVSFSLALWTNVSVFLSSLVSTLYPQQPSLHTTFSILQGTGTDDNSLFVSFLHVACCVLFMRGGAGPPGCFRVTSTGAAAQLGLRETFRMNGRMDGSLLPLASLCLWLSACFHPFHPSPQAQVSPRPAPKTAPGLGRSRSVDWLEYQRPRPHPSLCPQPQATGAAWRWSRKSSSSTWEDTSCR